MFHVLVVRGHLRDGDLTALSVVVHITAKSGSPRATEASRRFVHGDPALLLDTTRVAAYY